MYQIIIDYNASSQDKMIVRNGIIQFNDKKLGYESKSLDVFLKDEQGKIQGGILAWLDTESIYIDILWVHEKVRGQGYGTKLLKTAENAGAKNACRYCTLDTYGFQAEEFYIKNGYSKLGEIKNYIREYSRIFLRKQIQ